MAAVVDTTIADLNRIRHPAERPRWQMIVTLGGHEFPAPQFE
jgi:hypothetical protein